MEILARIPTGRRGMGVGVVDDRFIWTFDGFDGDKVDDVIEMCVTSKTGEWKTFECEDDISTCFYSRAVVVNGQGLDQLVECHQHLRSLTQ